MGNFNCCKAQSPNSPRNYEPLAVQVINNDNKQSEKNDNYEAHEKLVSKVDHMEQKMEAMQKQIQQLDQMLKSLIKQRCCPNGHVLAKFIIKDNGFCCDGCSSLIPQNTDAYGCRQCNYDLCTQCNHPNETKDDSESKDQNDEIKEQIEINEAKEAKEQNETKQELDPKIIDIAIQCNGTISECGHLQRLKLKMASNNSNDTAVIVEDLFHLMNSHPTDPEFHVVYNALGGKCQDDASCSMFSRNHRNRGKLKNNDELNALYNVDSKDITIPTQQIIDKIHCHYRHCYDIGNRLPLEIQKQMMDEDDKKEEYDDYQDQHLDYFVNSKCKRTNESNADKYQKYRDIRRLNECNKFMMSPIQDDDIKEEVNLYSFGFRYVYHKEQHDKEKEKFAYYIGYVKKKYKSFKKELISNDICTVSLEQFNNEQSKANIYFDQYKKSDFAKHWTLRHSYVSDAESFTSEAVFAVEHIVSVMVYCNFDSLQSEFTKTYRKALHKESKDDVVKRHSNYYFLGRYLSELVFHGGMDARDKTLYHGISKDLILSNPRTADIFSPLSSTSSIQVAVNFAHPDGIIIQFTPNSSRNKCFSCAPVSDYGNEEEFLFLESGYRLEIKNVIVARTAVEYRQILNVVGLIENCYSNNYIPKYLKKIHDRLVKHELFTYGKLDAFEAWKGLDDYPEKMMHQYCIKKKGLNIYLNRLCSTPLFIDEKGWVKLDILNALFPNLRVLKIESSPIIRLTKTMMNNILDHLQKQYCKLQTIEITISQIGFDAQSAINEFSELFEKINFSISVPRSYDYNESINQLQSQHRGGYRDGYSGFRGNMGRRGVTDRTKNYDVLQILKIE